MKSPVMFCTAALLITAYATSQSAEPWTDNFNEPRNAAIAKEARPFIIRRQGCDHFRGEEGYDEDRARFLQERIGELCTGTDAELKRLRAKYVNHPETMKALADFEDCIEYVTKCEVN